MFEDTGTFQYFCENNTDFIFYNLVNIKFSKQQELNELVTSTIKDALYKSLLIPKVEIKEEKAKEMPPIIQPKGMEIIDARTKPIEEEVIKPEVFDLYFKLLSSTIICFKFFVKSNT